MKLFWVFNLIIERADNEVAMLHFDIHSSSYITKDPFFLLLKINLKIFNLVLIL
jgi:hypothetical protein